MKLRIKGNSIRMRLMQSEVRTLKERGILQERVEFPSGQYLVYTLTTGTDFAADFNRNELMVTLPLHEANEWFTSEDLSLSASLDLANGEALSLLIEKDLACLMPRAGEDESDAYPNPKRR